MLFFPSSIPSLRYILKHRFTESKIVYIHTHTYTVYIHTHIWCVHTHTRMYIYKHTYMYIYTNICIHLS